MPTLPEITNGIVSAFVTAFPSLVDEIHAPDGQITFKRWDLSRESAVTDPANVQQGDGRPLLQIRYRMTFDASPDRQRPEGENFVQHGELLIGNVALWIQGNNFGLPIAPADLNELGPARLDGPGGDIDQRLWADFSIYANLDNADYAAFPPPPQYPLPGLAFPVNEIWINGIRRWQRAPGE